MFGRQLRLLLSLFRLSNAENFSTLNFEILEHFLPMIIKYWYVGKILNRINI